MIPDHPEIESAMRTGYPSWMQTDTPVCPVCGEETETYYAINGDVVGCENCVDEVSAWEV